MSRPQKKFSTDKEDTPQNARELGNKKKFHPNDLISLTAKTKSQKRFIEAYYSQCPIIVQDGPAGTGKTYLAMYTALSEVFDSATPYDKLIVIRTAVETRKIGFLPGSLEEKNEAFERPYMDIVNQLTKYNNSYEYTKMLGYYEFMTTSHLRGTTFDNAIIILDEAQNGDIDELSTVVTRIGTNSKLLIIGDSKQNDLSRQKQESGFEHLKKIFDNMPSELVTRVTYTLDDIVRSKLVKEFLIAADKT